MFLHGPTNKPPMLHCVTSETFTRVKNPFSLFVLFHLTRSGPSIRGRWQFGKWESGWRHHLLITAIKLLLSLDSNIENCSVLFSDCVNFQWSFFYARHQMLRPGEMEIWQIWAPDLTFEKIQALVSCSLCVWRRAIALAFLALNKSQNFEQSNILLFCNRNRYSIMVKTKQC